MGVRRKSSGTANFLARSRVQWLGIGVRAGVADTFALLPALGHARLVREGALSAAEIALVRAVAAGSADHVDLSRERARMLVRDLDGTVESL